MTSKAKELLLEYRDHESHSNLTMADLGVIEEYKKFFCLDSSIF